MAEFNQNLWAPWRMDYIRSLADEADDDGCFLCNYWNSPDRDAANHVIWRTDTILVVMNRFPYTNGHLLVANGKHKGEFAELDEEELQDVTIGLRDGVALLRKALSPQGFNAGFNLGHCAGAGLPDHLHAHIVPRWSGDTNFMTVLDNARVIPQALDALYESLTDQARQMGLRR